MRNHNVDAILTWDNLYKSMCKSSKLIFNCDSRKKLEVQASGGTFEIKTSRLKITNWKKHYEF